MTLADELPMNSFELQRERQHNSDFNKSSIYLTNNYFIIVKRTKTALTYDKKHLLKVKNCESMIVTTYVKKLHTIAPLNYLLVTKL